MGRGRLDLRTSARARPATRQRRALPAAHLHVAEAATIRAASPCRCCGTSSAETIVNNEFLRDHPHAQHRLRRVGDARRRLLSGGAARRDRCDQHARLRRPEQRRLPCGFATAQEAYEEALRRAVRRRWTGWRTAPVDASRYPVADDAARGGLAAVHDADALRRRLCRPLQVQPAADRGLSQPVELYCANSTRARRRRDGQYRHIKRHYYASHHKINPTRIVPAGRRSTSGAA